MVLEISFRILGVVFFIWFYVFLFLFLLQCTLFHRDPYVVFVYFSTCEWVLLVPPFGHFGYQLTHRLCAGLELVPRDPH